MSVIWRRFIGFMFICQFSRISIESISIYPHLVRPPRIFHLVEGEQLRLECRYYSLETHFHFAEINFSLLQRNFSYDEGAYIKSSVLSEDSGWYRCSEHSPYTYISVKKNSGYFVDDKVSSMLGTSRNDIWNVHRFEYEAWIYCEPMNSSYDVQVYKDGKSFNFLEPSFNPKKEYMPVNQPGSYKCELTTGKQVIAMKEYNVTEYDGSQLLISGDQCSHFNNKTEFRVNCSIAYPFLVPKVHDSHRQKKSSPKWNFRNAETVDYTSNEYSTIRHPIFDNYLISTHELVIRTISSGMTREFECSVQYGDRFLNRKIHLIINRPDFRGINLLTTFSESSKIIKTVGDNVQFTVGIEAYPDQPDIIWRDQRGREVLANREKFEIRNSCEQTELIINDLNLEDRGIYRVEVKNLDPGSSKTFTFNLEVWGKGFIKTLDNVAEYYMQNEFAKIHCIVDRSQELYITWSFRERSNSLSNLSESTLDEMIIETNKTTLVWKVQSSGYITCMACDISDKVPNKCENLTRSIFITDVPGGFGIISPNREIVTNETVELICAASVHHFTEKIEWLDDSGTSLVISDALNVIETKTTLTYRAKLSINPVQMSDARNYACSATRHDGEKRMKHYKLDVHHPRGSKFVLTNMNRLEIIHHIGISLPEEIILKCYVDGLPKPVVTWWKDGVQLKLSQRGMMKICNLQSQNENRELHIEYLNEKCSGMYRCRAENHLGVEEAYQNITIHKISRERIERIIEWWNVLMILMTILSLSVVVCSILIIHCWISKKRMEKTVKGDRINFNFIKTKLSYQAILTFNSVSGADNGTYICCSMSHHREMKRANYTLRVHEPLEPYFIKTNMNGSTEKNLNTLTSSEHIILECYPGGRPQPVVSWWKDAARMNTTSQTDTQVCRHNFRNNGQQLYIDNLDEDCTALYQCQATNKMGVIGAHQSIMIKRVESPEPEETESSASEETISPNLMIIIGFITSIVIFICLGSGIFLWKKRRRAEIKLKEMVPEDFHKGHLEFLKPGLTYAERAQFQPYETRWEFPQENLSFQGVLGTGSFGVVQVARAKDLVGKGTDWLVSVKKPRYGGDKCIFIRALARELKIMMHLGKHLNVVNLLGACTKEMKKFKLLVIMEYCHFGNLGNYLRNNNSEFISQIDTVTGEIDLSIDRDESNEKRSSNRSPPDAVDEKCEMSSGADIKEIQAKCNCDESIDSQSSESSPPDAVDGEDDTTSDAELEEHAAGCDREVNTEETLSSNKGSSDQRIFQDSEFLPLKTKTLLSWAFQVSNGMEYLRQKKVLHGDLAARNILLAKRNVVKISDFGLSKELHERDNYKKTSDGPLPFKWMAIESLKDGIFSTKSDVWSFGIVLWEFFELGNQPYMGIPKSKLLQKLENGYRMQKPKYATQGFYDLMMQCWNIKPDSRPSFNDLIAWFGCLMDQDEKMYLEQLNFLHHAENEK